MAKATRTPYNSSRYKLTRISSSTSLNSRISGDVVLVETGGTPIDLSTSFLDNGGYFKIILKNDTDATVSISVPTGTLNGVTIDDVDGSNIQARQASDNNSISISSGAAAGSYLDFICDGTKWYVSGMAYGAAWSIA